MRQGSFESAHACSTHSHQHVLHQGAERVGADTGRAGPGWIKRLSRLHSVKLEGPSMSTHIYSVAENLKTEQEG